MRLYLSSYRLGNHVDKLADLVGEKRRVAIIDNAIDNLSQKHKEHYQNNVYDIHSVFQGLGYTASAIDLREFFDNKREIGEELKQYDLIWACGGNVFLLRRAMSQSGFDKAISQLLNDDQVAYGGWSAGICVLGPTLEGFELCDHADDVCHSYNSEILWDGLNIIDYAIAPHYRSNHPEAPIIENVVAYFKRQSIQHKTLRDGDVIIYDEKGITLHKAEDSSATLANNDMNRQAVPRYE